jgi:hypothetical protein
MKLAATLFATLAVLWTRTASAFFTGPDGCAAAGDAAGGLTDLDNAELVPFDESGVIFTINGQAVTAITQILLEVEGDYDFAIEEDSSPFVGGLIRVQQGDGAEPTFTFEPSDTPRQPDSQLDEACESPVIGLTTLDTETEKSSLTGRFVATSTTDPVTVDVTVVLTNTTDSLTYTYTQFELRTTVPENNANNETVPGPSPGSGGTTETLEPTTTRPPTSSPAPSFEQECLICGDADLQVTNLDATVIVNNVNASCALIVQIAQDRRIPPGNQCDDTIAAVLENCDCAPINATTTNATETLVPNGNETMVPGGTNETMMPGGTNETMMPTNETMMPGLNETNSTALPVDANETMVPMNETTATNETMVPNTNETMVPNTNETMAPNNTTDTNTTDTNETVTPPPDEEPAPAPPTPTRAAPPTGSTRDVSSAESLLQTTALFTTTLLAAASLAFLGTNTFL